MFESYELRRNGPYLRVILPDVLPPDWTVLARDLELELDEGVESATLVTPHIDVAGGDLDRILQLSSMLTRQGLPVRLELREDASLVQA
jgi:hypothetical protein